MNFIKYILIIIYRFTSNFGIDPIKFISSLRGLPYFFVDFFYFIIQQSKRSDFRVTMIHPILYDRFESSGTMSGHYFHQDLYVAKEIYKRNPLRHIDIGSRIDGFVTHVAVFRKIEIIDIREQKNKAYNIHFTQADLMKLPSSLVEASDSVSCLHSIEHFGLGRYGDPIDCEGHIKAINNIHSILKRDGIFYFSTPIGPQRIEFNAQRVFSIDYLLDLIEDKFKVISFSYVDDKGEFFENTPLTDSEIKKNYNCLFGCGIFILKKL
jgi:SAM-dependent methyltransferase